MAITAKAPIDLKENQHILQISNKGVQMGNVLKDLIIQTLNITNGNQIKAAKLLAISIGVSPARIV